MRELIQNNLQDPRDLTTATVVAGTTSTSFVNLLSASGKGVLFHVGSGSNSSQNCVFEITIDGVVEETGINLNWGVGAFQNLLMWEFDSSVLVRIKSDNGSTVKAICSYGLE